MISKIGNRNIKITPRQLKENEKHCEVCGGTGWMYIENDGESYIEKCINCDNGIIHICPDCGKELGRGTYCNSKECFDKKEKEHEEKRYNKSTKYTLETAPKESINWFYSDSYGYNEGYFDDIDDLKDYCKEENIKPPKFIWGTSSKSFSLDAYDIIENNLEDWYEDAISYVNDKSLKELQSTLDKFCKECGITDCYEVDYNVCIEL